MNPKGWGRSVWKGSLLLSITLLLLSNAGRATAIVGTESPASALSEHQTTTKASVVEEARVLPMQPTMGSKSDTMPKGLRDAVLSTLHTIVPEGDGNYRAVNPNNQFSTRFGPDGIEVRPKQKGADWRWSMRLLAYGYDQHVLPVTAPRVSADASPEYSMKTKRLCEESCPMSVPTMWALARDQGTAIGSLIITRMKHHWQKNLGISTRR